LGLGWQRSFGEKQSWVLFGGTSLQRMLGPAADAPFIERKTTWSADLGLAYRH
jgi:outer membrane scaffolding protein for murein synthesis (MipA/OmpV family)